VFTAVVRVESSYGVEGVRGRRDWV